MKLTKREIEFIERFSRALLASIDIESQMRTNNTQEFYYPYIPNTDIASIIKAMLKYDIRSIADLGCGEAHIIYILKLLRFNVMGVEVCDSYIKAANKLLPSNINLIHKDIFDLEVEDIKYLRANWEYERDGKEYGQPKALYFYEPVFTKELAFDFVDKIIKLAQPGQYIIHKPAGPNMVTRFNIHRDKGNIVLMDFGPLWVYKTLKR